jgi:hypothetical protein
MLNLDFVRTGAAALLVLLACTPEPKGTGEKCDAAAGTLPAAGSACASAGEVCVLPAEDICAPGPFVECEGGAWVEKPGVPAEECGDTTLATTADTSGAATGTPTTGGSTGGGVACDPNNLPEIGSPCAMEGEFCSPGCPDPCQFCNVVKCEGGVWTQLEAPPGRCASCEEICPPTVAAMCPAGPPDEAACVAGCMDIMQGRCALAYSQVRACAGPGPAIACDPMGRPTGIGCEAQFDDLYQCLGI